MHDLLEKRAKYHNHYLFLMLFSIKRVRKKSKKKHYQSMYLFGLYATLVISSAILEKSPIMRGCDLYDNSGVIIPLKSSILKIPRKKCVICSLNYSCPWKHGILQRSCHQEALTFSWFLVILLNVDLSKSFHHIPWSW